MQKVIIWILTMTLLLTALTGCNSSNTEKNEHTNADDDTVNVDNEIIPDEMTVILSEEIDGSWRGYTYMTYKELEGTWMYETIYGFESNVGIPVTVTFGNDGKVVVEIADDEETDEALDLLNEELEACFVDAFYDTAAEMGMNKEEADRAAEAEFGMSYSEYAEEIVEDIDVRSIYIARLYEGEYTINNEKMTVEIDGNALEVEIRDNNLIIVDADDDDELEALFGNIPIQLERIN